MGEPMLGRERWRRRARGRAAGRVAAVFVLALLLGGSVAVTAHPGHPPADACPDGRVVTRGPWTSIVTPSFPDSSSRRLTDHAAARRAPAHLLVTNGTSVLASSDGGCEWGLVLQAPTVPGAAGAVRLGEASRFTIGALQFPGPIAYLALVGTDGTGQQTSRVMASEDFGQTWRDASAGLPPVGQVRWLVAAPGAGTTAYAMVDDSGLYATEDGGVTWLLRQPSEPNAPGFVHLAVDPLDPRDVWAWRGPDLFRSRDGGATFARSVGSAQTTDVLAVDVGHVPGGAARILVAYRSDRAARSDDGGETFRAVSVPPGVMAMASSITRPDHVVVTTETKVYASVPATGSWQEITPPSAERFTQPRSTAIERPMVFVRSENGLERTILDQPIAAPDRDLGVPPLRLAPPQPPRLDPPGGEIRVDPGAEVSVPRSLTVPFRRGPLDVFFLVDTTNSMGPLLRELAAGITSIAGALQGARIDARFGVGEHKDYPLAPYGRSTDFPYRRVRDLGPADDSLRAALAGLQDGGGEDVPESQLAALFQVATGTGQVGVIAAGQQASFRPEARRVVILGTDARFHRSDGDPTYPGPRFSATMAALRERGIAVVGISLDPDARPDLQQVAVATGAIASIDVDCTGDGARDLLAGQPLVCPLDPDAEHLAAAVVATLNGVEDVGEIVVSATGGSGVVRGVAPASSGPVNLRIDHRFDFSVTYGCRADQAGQRFPVALTATAKGAAVLAATDTVVCARADAPAAAAPPPAASSPAEPAPPPPTPASPSPPPAAPVVQPPVVQPQPQVQPSPQLGPQVQPGVAAQEQEQLQLALAGIEGPVPDGDPEAGEVLAFSARREHEPGVPFAASTLSLTVVAAVLGVRHRSRTRSRLSVAPVSRRNP